MDRLSRRSFLIAGSAALAGAACGASSSDEAGPSAATTVNPSPGATGSNAAPSGATPSPPAPGTTAPASARFVVRGPDKEPQVALTFHTNGDLRLAQRLLDIVNGERVAITGFVIGNWLADNPAWARKFTDGGHELGNHTWSHPDAKSMRRAALDTEIVRCRDLLVRLTGSPGRFFRPSGFDDGTEEPPEPVMDASLAAGYVEVAGFDVDPLDYKDPGANTVTRRTLDTVRAGSIISLHFGHAGTVDALPAILAGLADRGLRPVTLGRLLA